jgi:hypothetical protein
MRRLRVTVPVLAIGLLALGTVVLSAIALAQAPRGEDDIVWSTFVGGPGRSPASGDLGADPGELALGTSPWRCGYGRVRHAAISGDDWSVQRVLACQRADATVSSTASCRVHDGRVEEHAATLSLGSVGESNHITVTLSCRARRR